MADAVAGHVEPQRHPPPRERSRAAAEFEKVYRAHVGPITAYFARRSSDPQTVADLTADTFVRAITSFATFDPVRGSARAWLFGIASRVFAGHCEAHSRRGDSTRRIAGQRLLDADVLEDLVDRIDAEQAGGALLARLAELPRLDREVVELVDLDGLSPKEAAEALGVSAGALRIRLFRARATLRKTTGMER
ncbi:RNA polymerase sigma-70 factor (ECF subfamily) [Saccharothrix saharensis]|uniref:RNA polymerase sigma-70 factor (ECF subfamily) n=1 Tax=Saccharothrix saharensis TaxID=571190 RepID=A0A543JQY5_9PSEU|nr:RNA polymerase sigma factor [Saccharothrix saharensis]TQM85253.1 RNA polymerase sigma-70 factor (ECF subfamily) [Saccharothrix saharensis]